MQLDQEQEDQHEQEDQEQRDLLTTKTRSKTDLKSL